MKISRNIWGGVIIIIVIIIVGAIYIIQDKKDTNSQTLCYTDKLNGFTIQLPIGWRADVPPSPNTVGGASVFYNYEEEEVVLDHGQVVSIPADYLKIIISGGQREANQSLEEWLRLQTSSDTALEFKPYKLGQYKGIISTVNTNSEEISEIVLAHDETQVTVITLTPADSPAFFEAISMLETLDFSQEGCEK